MEANTPNYKPILPEDFDVPTLRRLARDGRLYFDANEPTVDMSDEEHQQQILQYVGQIDSCVTPAYGPYITQIWRCIITDDRLNQNLFISKGRNRGQTNRYRVVAIVGVLLSMEVYAQSRYTLLDLHHRLEHTTHKDCIYTSQQKYALTHQQCVLLRQAVKKMMASDAV